MCVYIKGQSGFILCLHSLFISYFKTDALMLEVSKGVEICSMCEILCYEQRLNAMYVKDVERSSKWSYTSLLITFLIFNQFSIHIKVLESCELELSSHVIKHVC